MPHLDLRSALSVPAFFRLFKRAIGADNVIREHAVIHVGTEKGGGCTRIGRAGLPFEQFMERQRET